MSCGWIDCHDLQQSRKIKLLDHFSFKLESYTQDHKKYIFSKIFIFAHHYFYS
jgi:hypothetical protein